MDGHGPSEELAPVFISLASDIDAARTLIEHAETDATEILRRARDDASALLARARLEARSARAEAAARVTEENTARDKALLAKAHDDAEVLARTGATMIPELTRAVIDRMLSELQQP